MARQFNVFYLRLVKWYHSWFGTKERKFDSCIGDQVLGEEASMVMQKAVTLPPSGTTGSIPVFSTKSNDSAHYLTVVSDDELYRNFH